MVWKGERILSLGVTSIPATTSATYYFPPNRPDSVGAAIVPGWRHNRLKGFMVRADDAQIFTVAVGYVDLEGNIHWDGLKDIPAENWSQAQLGQTWIELVADVRDMQCFCVRIHNTDAANAHSVNIWVRYEPVQD